MSQENEFLIELQNGFLDEANDLLVSIEDSFLELERNPRDQKHIENLLRVFHNLKGSAGAVGFEDLSKFCHAVESKLVFLKNGTVPISGMQIDLLLRSADRLRAAIAGLKKDKSFNVDYQDLRIELTKASVANGGQDSVWPRLSADLDPRLFSDFLSDASDQLESIDSGLTLLEKDPRNSEALNELFRGFHTLKSASAILGYEELSSLSHELESLLDRIRGENVAADPQILGFCFEAVGVVRKFVESLSTGTAGAGAVGQAREALVQQRLKITKELNRDSPEARIQGVEALHAGQTRENSDIVSGAVKEAIRVDAERLDRLVDTIGELVISEAMVAQAPALKSLDSTDSIFRHLNQLSKISRSLHEIGMSLRMVPIRPTFKKMTRIVRDISKKLDKPIEFETVGEEIELDKTVVEKISDPLVHMVRNAVDHGIEKSSTERAGFGKPEAGRVILRAIQKSGSTWIEVEDDGRGLDRDAILNKAIEKRLVPENAHLTDAEIFGLIFLPGFSTAEKVTDISGRGVGMDVVRKNIELIRGQVEIASEKGRGTRFTIRIPNTLAIMEGMVVTVGVERYVVPSHAISSSMKIPPRDLVTIYGGRGEAVVVQGTSHPLIRLSRFFDVPGNTLSPKDGIGLFVEESGTRAVLLVDGIIKQQQFVMKSLGEYIKRAPGISGGTIMPDGGVGLILDIGAIMKRDAERWHQRIVKEEMGANIMRNQTPLSVGGANA
ncbi:MAG: hypothetical protein A2428_01815 [Bdellovibrionales bacterium RIFOXYC1_FULL_54_43]|nr:MAG: hypothetical protein A2428_01815 [Bdellovibrionales bacterium RIFOXYC1_FULL_54_43]OFZ81676.1 MAG: hypothetical protein A2603_12025 [Bdellovibrionales bacterium RIFOXYD1_FULL_55_31]